ncbi:C-type lectin domain family 12 member A-like isoform X1 [Bos javanicus]|uniref:C-type lectin domain family 12 member A-like isoform X1 n=1 Tax=Bos javanicus TaxID=9906 RepID=UPI002AA8FD9E|nr:C-type lectin domain family 12 member A-like isoform X1 [Bos javanicus]
MSEEVTYADLKFQDSSQTENIQKFDKFEKEDPPVPSHVWRQGALALTLLCLLLLIGLGVFGAIYLKTLKTGMEKLNKLQNFKEELQRNLSLQLMQNTNSSQKIRNLSIKLEEIATKLCRELYTKNKEHKCKPCPEEWMWHDDKCYLLHAYQRQETWQKSDEICSDYNASLLTIKSKSVLEFIKSLKLNNYWLRLSPRKDNTKYGNLDTIFPLNWFTRNTSVINDQMYCGYVYYANFYYIKCTETKNIICEKLAQPVKTESILMSEILDGRK